MVDGFMKRAIEIAKAAEGEIPVGAVIVCAPPPSPEGAGERIIAAACNCKEALNDVTAHAEIVAIREAAAKLGRWRLDDCTMYVTLEPCPMCAWAVIQARLKAVYFGSYDANYGALGSAMDLRVNANSKLQVYGGIDEEECNVLLEKYFASLRGRSTSERHGVITTKEGLE
jgi:tRNA(adenine34) deaminase